MEKLLNSLAQKGHWKLNSGRHSDLYIFKDLIGVYPELRARILTAMEDAVECQYPDETILPITFTGPAVAGIPLAAALAERLFCPFVYPEKKGSGMWFRYPFNYLLSGRKVIIVEDVVTTATSIRKVKHAVEAHGGEVVGALCVVSRSHSFDKLDIPFLYAYEHLQVQSFDPHDCPLCKKGEPLIDPKTGTVLEGGDNAVHMPKVF